MLGSQACINPVSVDYSLEDVGQVGLTLSRSQSENLLVDSGDMMPELPNISSADRRLRYDSINSSNSSDSFIESDILNYANQMNLQLPEVYSTNNNSACSSISDAHSPQLISRSPEYLVNILFPSEDGQPPIKKPSPRNSDPVTILDQSVLIQKSRLAELEYIEKNMKEIIALNLKNYIDSLSPE